MSLFENIMSAIFGHGGISCVSAHCRASARNFVD